jgi:CBS domain-containing protein
MSQPTTDTGRTPDASTLTASDVMTANPRTCSPYSTVIEAVLIFRDADCGAVPVVDAGRPVGILTDRDVALALADHPDLATRSVADIMSEGVVSVKPDSSLREIEALFGQRGIRRVLVVDDQHRILGIVAWADVAPHASNREIGAFVSNVVEQP